MSELKNLYSFYWDCGRGGSVEGLFIATPSEIEEITGKQIYLGEVLGKHSEVYGEINEGDIKLVSDDQDKVSWLGGLMVSNTISGYNPLDYYERDEEE